MRCPDISLAKSKLDWVPEFDRKTGLNKTIDYFDALNERERVLNRKKR